MYALRNFCVAPRLLLCQEYSIIKEDDDAEDEEKKRAALVASAATAAHSEDSLDNDAIVVAVTAAAAAATERGELARTKRDEEKSRLAQAKSDAEVQLSQLLENVGQGKTKLQAVRDTLREEAGKAAGGCKEALSSIMGELLRGYCYWRIIRSSYRAVRDRFNLTNLSCSKRKTFHEIVASFVRAARP